MTDIDDIKKIIANIRNRRAQWKLSSRHKNLMTLSELGIDQEIAFDVIYNRLRPQNYISGPEPDDHPTPIPGNVWVFGLIILELSN